MGRESADETVERDGYALQNTGPGSTARTTSTKRSAFSWRVNLRYRAPLKFLAGWVGLAMLLLVAAVLQPDTFNRFSTELITGLAGCLLVASLGQNLVVMLGFVDLSVPAFITSAAAMNVHFVGQLGAVESVAISLAVCASLAAVTGALISYLRVNAVIATFGMNAVVAGGLLLWIGQSWSTTGAPAPWLLSLANSPWLHVSALFWVALVIAVLTAAVLSRTRPGRRVAAVGDNRMAARLLGARVGAITVTCFAAAGVFYGVAGLLLAGLVQNPDSTLGDPYQLTTITVVAIAGTSFAGGRSSIASLVAAALLLTTLDQVLDLANLSGATLDIAQGALLVAALSMNMWADFGRFGFSRLRQVFGAVPG
jgi:ribose transport system permease protein